MLDWAKQEVKLACKFENPDWDGKEFDYGCSCYQSALKAYESLMEDGHSGTSFGFTKNILIRLLESLPLRPIEDSDFFLNNNKSFWADEDLKAKNLKSILQCPRMYSLFREETIDGKITYSDNNRYYCIDINNGCTYSNGIASDILDELFPITMPYFPLSGRYKIYAEDFLLDPKNGDYDTKGFLYLETPSKERVEINRFYAEKDNETVEITEKEYNERKELFRKRIESISK